MIERTFDYREVKRRSGESPIISSDCIYLIDDEFLWGLEAFKDGYLISRNDNPPAEGKKGKASAHRMFKWMFENTESMALYGKIHKDDKPAKYAAAHGGMMRDFSKDDYIYYKVVRK